MKLHVNKETKKIIGYTLIGNPIDDNCDFIEVEMNEDEITEDLFFSKFEDGRIILDEDYKSESLLADKIKELRDARETKCFSIINRGQPWYNTLSTEQLVEIQTWYQAWLDAPQTLVEPEKPSWIKE